MKVSLVAVITCVLLLGSNYYCYSKGFSSGSEEVKSEMTYQTNRLQEQLRTKEQDYRTEVEKLEQQILTNNERYRADIDSIHSSYTSELLKSQQRADYYRKLYSKREASCNLSEYTGKLDRALTEGISLVRELKSTLERREQELRELGQYLELENSLHE